MEVVFPFYLSSVRDKPKGSIPNGNIASLSPHILDSDLPVPRSNCLFPGTFRALPTHCGTIVRNSLCPLSRVCSLTLETSGIGRAMLVKSTILRK